MTREKGKKPLWKDLLLLPFQLVMDLILLYTGAYLDTRIVSPEAEGHPTFALTILFAAMAGIITAAVATHVLIRVIRFLFRKDK